MAIFKFPLPAGAIAALAGYTAFHLVHSETTIGQMCKLAVGSVIAAAVHLPLLRWFARDLWDETLQRGRLLGR